jgi:histidinol-phosphate phosphatase family protein
MTRAVFLDRDGVINEDTGYPHKAEDLVILPGVPEALQRLRKMGFLLFFVTNQSGIGRGYYSLADFECFNAEIIECLEKQRVTIQETYLCPHRPDEACACRKPGIANLKKAEQDYAVSLPESYVIGDRQSDIDLGRNAGCYSIYVIGEPEPADVQVTGADYVADNILKAVDWIADVEQEKNKGFK